LGAATGVARAFTEIFGEVAAASVVEVTVKEPKQISVGLARMSTMLAEKMTLHRATMLHS
jgi:ubiquinone biosynthesis protein UbiJ